MYGGVGGRINLALVLGVGLLIGTAPARAADLGGDCCADLEERIAELEATAARKGNRKVSLASQRLRQRGGAVLGRRARKQRLLRAPTTQLAHALPLPRRSQDQQGMVGRLPDLKSASAPIASIAPISEPTRASATFRTRRLGSPIIAKAPAVSTSVRAPGGSRAPSWVVCGSARRTRRRSASPRSTSRRRTSS